MASASNTPGYESRRGIEQFALAGRELGSVGFEIVLHQGAARSGIAEIVGIPLEESVDLARVRVGAACRFKVVALGAPLVALGMPALIAREHSVGQAAMYLVVVLGNRVGFSVIYSQPTIPASRFAAAGVTIDDMISCRNLTRRFGEFTAVSGSTWKCPPERSARSWGQMGRVNPPP